jgi:hypothetical protein
MNIAQHVESRVQKALDERIGDWNVSPHKFPNGLMETAEDSIRECGMIPGIWFEFEVCTGKSMAFSKTDHLLKRDGDPITVGKRRFWDMNDPFVIHYLSDKVIITKISALVVTMKIPEMKCLLYCTRSEVEAADITIELPRGKDYRIESLYSEKESPIALKIGF